MTTKIIMPEMGEGVTEGTLSQWLKKEGDPVEQFEPILEIETDKVTTEAIAEERGVLLQIAVKAGTVVTSGTVLGYIGQPGETVTEAPENGRAAPSHPSPKPTPVRSGPYTGRVSPVVGRIAAEHAVDLNQVPGTGRDGRITKRDILAYIEQREQGPPLSPEPEPGAQNKIPIESTPVPPQPAAAGEILPLTNMRRAIAAHMVMSKRTSPHVTTVFEFDFTAVAAHRRAHKAQFAQDGARLTFTPYIVAATVQALKQHPQVNSSWTDAGIQLKREIHIGMATALDEGLIVPVINNADGMNLLGLARAVNDLAERARYKQLQPSEVQGGTFSITNHGVTGSLFATPIINQPQCGILGIGKIEKRVKVIDDALAIRQLAYASFTFDHRILDGAAADRFVGEIKGILENWE
jgi:2-oxoisovalerate dehydrogenase E2 component (dihydrolipoyl transacylase)